MGIFYLNLTPLDFFHRIINISEDVKNEQDNNDHIVVSPIRQIYCTYYCHLHLPLQIPNFNDQ